MTRQEEFRKLEKQITKTELLEHLNRLAIGVCLLITFHSLGYINTDKKLTPVHYAGFAGGIACIAGATKLESKKQEYLNRRNELQRGE